MEQMDAVAGIERAWIEHAKEKRIPLIACFELLPLCNMNCDMCYVRLSKDEAERQGGLRTADEWIALAQRMKDMGLLTLQLTGGEPLLFPEFKRLYVTLKKMGLMTTINTNGTLIDEQWADFFAQNPPRRFSITLYGADEKAYTELCHYPGGFAKTLRAVRLLRQRGLEVKLNYTVTRTNADDLWRVFEIAEELNVPINVASYVTPASRERSQPFDRQMRLLPQEAGRINAMAYARAVGRTAFLNEAQRQLWFAKNLQPGEPRMTCQAGRCSVMVNWQGMMRPCIMLDQPSISLRETDVQVAWKQITEYVDSVRTSSRCASCALRLTCPVCAASALAETGNCDGTPEYLCRYTQQTLLTMAEICMHEMQRRRRNGEEAEDGKE